MVNRLARVLIVAGLLGLLKVSNVPDERGGVAVSSRSATVKLVVFVVQDEPLLVFLVKHPALMCVGGALVRSHGDELRVGFVRHVVDGLLFIVIKAYMEQK